MNKISRITWMVMVVFIATTIAAFACDEYSILEAQKAGSVTIGCDVNPYSTLHNGSDDTVTAQKADSETVGCDVNPYPTLHNGSDNTLTAHKTSSDTTGYGGCDVIEE
jgi:hypothetical protein